MKKFIEIKLIERQGKQGVGKAICSGIGSAKGNILVPMMGDHSENSLDLIQLVDAIARGYHMAIGNRFKFGKPIGYPFLKYLMNRCFNYLIKIIFLFPSSDITNAFKAYNARILDKIGYSSKGFEIFAEIPIKNYLSMDGVKIVDIPIEHIVRKKKEAKLSLLKDGPQYVKIIFSLFIYKVISRFSHQ